MYVPELHLTASNTPILNKAEIDDIGEHLVADFCPEAMRVPMTIDIDSFVETYLGFTQDYQYLSHNGIYLGMTVFCDTNKVPVYDPAHERAEYISAKAGTIIIDNRLLAENQEHRYRFTEGHEASHGILHGSFFEQKQTGTYADNHVPMVHNAVVIYSAIQNRIKTGTTAIGWNGKQTDYPRRFSCQKAW